MKLRIQGPSLRLRLTQPEVTTFAAGGEVRLQTGLGLDYALCQTAEKTLHASFEAGTLTVWVPEDLAAQWTGTDQVGFSATQPLPDGQTLQLLVKKTSNACTGRARTKPSFFLIPKLDQRINLLPVWSFT